MSEQEGPRTEQEIVGVYKQMRQDVGQAGEKLNDLDAQLQEHELVLKTLEPVEAGRTCFRLIGGVLVERTVAEVRPAVAANAENLRLAIASLRQQLESKQKQMLAFQQKFKIRVQGETSEDDPPVAAPSKGLLEQKA